jgi:hypothetical protein
VVERSEQEMIRSLDAGIRASLALDEDLDLGFCDVLSKDPNLWGSLVAW